MTIALLSDEIKTGRNEMAIAIYLPISQECPRREVS